MNPERWRQIGELYHAALERPQEHRSAFLAEVCANDDALRSEVEALLDSNEQASGFLSQPALEMKANDLVVEQITSPFTTRAGTLFGHYKIISRIGAGGMGEVWLAEDITLNRKVAIKLLPANFTANADRVRRFEQEARAASALNHPNIITVHEVGKFEETHYMVTEFVEGQTLRRRMAEETLSITQSLDIAIQISAALKAAHEARIVHRDIKPENVMIRRDGYVKVLDFGLAKLAEPEQPGTKIEAQTVARVNTEAGTVLGTASYMSPEQARGLKVDSRTDVFSLGIVLYEMIAGHRPFDGKTTMDVLAAILNQEPPRIDLLTGGETPFGELQHIVGKALRKEPDERYQTIRDLLVDLRNLKQEIEFQTKLGRSLPSNASDRIVGTDDAINPSQPRTSNRETDNPQTHSSLQIIIGEIKQHRTGAAMTLAILALVLAAGGYGLYQLVSGNQRARTFQNLKFSRLTSTGNIAAVPPPAISPNGNFAAYIVEEGGQRSLLVSQVATGSTLTIAPPAGISYDGLTFSPDGNHIYYAVGDGKTSSTLYRTPTVGGAPVRILSNIDSAITFSPDGGQFAFAGDLNTSLMIADADGKRLQKLIANQGEKRFILPAWSPDGKIIACAMSSSATGEPELVAINVRDGKEKHIGTGKWGRLFGLKWLPDGSGLVISATEKGARSYQLWEVSYPGGEAHRMTNDLSNYFGVSLTTDATHLVSTRQDRVINLWVIPDGDTDKARKITSESGSDDGLSGLAWTPDNRIVYSSINATGSDIWIINADGSNRKQLTLNAGRNHSPTISADGRYIVFVSDRTGESSLWRMDLEGGNVKRLTTDSAIVSKPVCLPNAPEVVYEIYRDLQRSLWQMPIDGGSPKQLAKSFSQLPAVSPDGKFIAYNHREAAADSSFKLVVLALEGDATPQLFNFPSVIKSSLFWWMPDGKGFVYLDSEDNVYNVWGQALNGGPPKRLTNFKTDRIFYFASSHDGRHLACARGRETSDLVLVSNFR
ncbi:MAG: protein kinase [Blastocatellales bacterium]